MILAILLFLRTHCAPSRNITFSPFLKIQLMSRQDTVSDSSSTGLDQSPEETEKNADVTVSQMLGVNNIGGATG